MTYDTSVGKQGWLRSCSEVILHISLNSYTNKWVNSRYWGGHLKPSLLPLRAGDQSQMAEVILSDLFRD